jgi:hypothetical protein
MLHLDLLKAPASDKFQGGPTPASHSHLALLHILLVSMYFAAATALAFRILVVSLQQHIHCIFLSPHGLLCKFQLSGITEWSGRSCRPVRAQSLSMATQPDTN